MNDDDAKYSKQYKKKKREKKDAREREIQKTFWGGGGGGALDFVFWCQKIHASPHTEKTRLFTRQKKEFMFSSYSYNAHHGAATASSREDEDAMETLAREFDREDVVGKLERECDALEAMEKKYQLELEEKKKEEEEKKETLERETKRAKEREEELKHLREEMEHQEKEIARLREVLRKVTFENFRKEEQKKQNRMKLLREYEALAGEMEERKKYPILIEKEKEKLREVEERLRKMCGGKFGKIETFEDFGEELNELFDRVVEKERDAQQRTLMAANDLLTKRKEPNFKAKEEDEDDEEGEDEEEEVELTTPVGEKKKVF